MGIKKACGKGDGVDKVKGSIEPNQLRNKPAVCFRFPVALLPTEGEYL